MLTIDMIAEKPGTRVRSFGRNRFLFPLFLFRDHLRRRGVRLRLKSNRDPLPRRRGDVLCLDSRALTGGDGRVTKKKLEALARWRQEYPRIVWFDNRDSSGTTQFEVLPYVDRYAKKQLLRDKAGYTRPLHAGRLFADYYHRRYGLTDDSAEEPVLLDDPSQAARLVLGWNLAYSDYRSRAHWERYVNYTLGFREPVFHNESERAVDLQARFSTSYDSRIVAFHRQRYMEIAMTLADRAVQVQHKRVALRDFHRDLRQSWAVLSPFGWGEICFRDFETFQYGCALIKPSMEHLETWPDLFRDGETYLGLPWDPDEAAVLMERVIHDRSLLGRVGAAGQEAFRGIWGSAGADAFVEHFLQLVRPD